MHKGKHTCLRVKQDLNVFYGIIWKGNVHKGSLNHFILHIRWGSAWHLHVNGFYQDVWDHSMFFPLWYTHSIILRHMQISSLLDFHECIFPEGTLRTMTAVLKMSSLKAGGQEIDFKKWGVVIYWVSKWVKAHYTALCCYDKAGGWKTSRHAHPPTCELTAQCHQETPERSSWQ